MTLEIVQPGLLTTVQDLGRPGYFHLGIPVGGAMDRLAMRTANMLVGNDEGAAGLESVFAGPKIVFHRDAVFAVCGAEIPVHLDGEEHSTWCAIAAREGQTLSFDYMQSGARIYIAVAGGIDVPLALGSRSTYPIGAMGGFEGRPLAAGDKLPLGAPSPDIRPGRSLGASLRRNPSSPVPLRVLPGLYDHRISPEALEGFFADSWTVAPEADRMGYRFRGGRPLDFVPREQPFGAGSDPSNVVDCCYPYGSIQVPGGTEPIVLHRDAVSGGGYCMIGTVISADMDLIAQMQPHAPTRFVRTSMEQALQARIDRSALLNTIRTSLDAPSPGGGPGAPT